MAIKGAKTIAEYVIRKWMEYEGVVAECFKLEMTSAYEAVIHDSNGDWMRLVYDPVTKMISIVE